MPYRDNARRPAPPRGIDREEAWRRLLDAALRSEARVLRTETRVFRALVLVAFMLWLAVMALLGRVDAQDRAPCVREPDHVLLARHCVSERGWRLDTADCAAIFEVVLARMEPGDSLRDALCRQGPHLHHGTITRRRWLLDLDEDGHRPEGLEVPWTTSVAAIGSSRRDAWLYTLEETALLIDRWRAGAHVPVCEREPRAWGSDGDLRERRRRGYRWVEVRCVLPIVDAGGVVLETLETVNHFGVVLVRTEGP
jgi:Ni/Co efflux regulator RcnB